MPKEVHQWGANRKTVNSGLLASDHDRPECEAPVDKLCQTCEDLDLSIDKFVPGQTVDSTLPGLLAASFKPASQPLVDLGYLEEIYRRRDRCSLCWLLFEATHSTPSEPRPWVQRSGHSKVRHFIGYDGLTKQGDRVRCSIEWQLDGRLLEPHGNKKLLPPTRRLRVFNPNDIFTDAYIMPLSLDLLPVKEPTFLARRIPRFNADLGLLQSWLEVCKSHHGSGCQPKDTSLGVSKFTENIRFVDLEDQAIILSSHSGIRVTEYATLSYVWGGNTASILRLTTQNLQTLFVKGSLGPDTPDLSRTVRDAMLVVKLLGIRFLWVDALCIIQDQSDDWRFMAPKMDSIYGNGTLNLCAAAGNNQGHGVPGSPNTPRHALQPIAQFAGLNLVTVKTVESLIEDTVWNSRAWTFQERMLSRRSIIFVDNRVFFQCRQATWSEEVFSENRTLSWTLEMVRSPLQMFEKNPVRLYLECVELFSGRALTYEMDRLPAFEGISAVLCTPLRASFFWGLPDSYFDLALLWENKVPTQRLGQPNHNNQDIRRKSGYPSWSWSGWHGASTWRLSMVSGVLMNVHHWLKSHTWIVWYRYNPYGSIIRTDRESSDTKSPKFPARDDSALSGNKTFGLKRRATSDWGLQSFASERYLHSSSILSAESDPFEFVWSSKTANHVGASRWHGYGGTKRPYGRQEPMTDKSDEELLQNVAAEPRPTFPTVSHLLEDCLYFWTYTAFFQLSRQSRSTSTFESRLEPGLHRFGLLDANGDWCGTIVLEDTWFARVGDIVEFAAISDARDFSMEELDSWNYYVPEDRDLSEWFLYYAFLLVWDKEHCVAERAGLAKIYQRAFNLASFRPGTAWREIVLG